MRVISGSARGHKLCAPLGQATRPTADYVREALFNILGGSVDRCKFLDLFAGTGAVGIEALSRGALEAVFVDSSRESVNIIRKNVEKTGFANNSTIYTLDVLKALKMLYKKHYKFDIIFLDPPYGREESFLSRVFIDIVQYGIIDESSICVIERQKKEKPLDFGKYGLIEIKSRSYSNAQISFLQRLALPLC